MGSDAAWSPFDPGEGDREVALVLLEAAALVRRSFPTKEDQPLEPGARQVMLTLAIAGQESARGLSRALALSLEDVFAALEALRRARAVRQEAFEWEEPAEQQMWELTSKGES